MDTHLQTLEILKDFHKITGARISLHDIEFNEIACYPDKLSGFCGRVQEYGAVRSKCLAADAVAFKKVCESGLGIIYKCHCGLIEIVAPIYNFGVMTGFFMMGQITDDNPESLESVKRLSAKYFSDEHELNAACEEIPLIKSETVNSYINILKIIAEYMTQTNRMTGQGQDLAASVKIYINRFYSRELTINLLCETFGCSRTTLINSFKKKFGQTVGRYITEYRIIQAENMLINSDISVKAISADCGFSDQNYFAKVFRAKHSLTPSEYRKSARKTESGCE